MNLNETRNLVKQHISMYCELCEPYRLDPGVVNNTLSAQRTALNLVWANEAWWVSEEPPELTGDDEMTKFAHAIQIVNGLLVNTEQGMEDFEP